jgi:hypothetical protein
VRVHDVMYHPDIAKQAVHSAGPGTVVDATGYDGALHVDDALVWVLLETATIKPLFEMAAKHVVNAVKDKGVALMAKDAKLANAAKNMGLHVVKEATTVAEAFSGQPCILGPKFVDQVVGSQEMFDKLKSVLGTPKLFGEVVTPHQLLISVLSCGAGE